MKSNIYFKYLTLLLFFAGLSACETEDELRGDIIADSPNPFVPVEVTADAGSADFSKYVAVGNSLTAGLMDGALYTEGQNNSFPNLLAKQFALAGGGEFVQPDIDTDRGFNVLLNSLSNPSSGNFGRFLLDTSVPAPSPLVPGAPLTPYTGSAVNNFGVPGARVVDLNIPQYGLETGGNYFYFRFASDPGVSTIMGDALAAQGSFHTLWIGSNDVLGWVSGGGVAPDGDVTPGAELNPSALTGTTNFTAAFTGTLDALTAGGGKVVVMNIPNILATPLLQAVSYDRIELDQATAEQLNTGLAPVNAALGAMTNFGVSQEEIDRRLISYAEGNNPILAIDDSLDDFGPFFDLLGLPAAQRAALEPFRQSRPLTANDFVILFSARDLGTVVNGDPNLLTGISYPIGDDKIITADEALKAGIRIATFNAIIAGAVAADPNAELVDANQIFTDVVEDFLAQGGYEVGGQKLTPDFSPNGIFSVDAVHPNPRGHGIIANEIIKVINEKFGATLPLIDVLNLPGVSIR